MEKQLQSSKAIVPQESQSLTEQDKKAEVITAYIEKFATVENRVVTPQLYAIYVEALSGFDLRQIEKGLKIYLETGTRWPWPGGLAEIIEDQI